MTARPAGTPVTTSDGYSAIYVAHRPDLGGHVVAMADSRCIPGEQFVVEDVRERHETEAEFWARQPGIPDDYRY